MVLQHSLKGVWAAILDLAHAREWRCLYVNKIINSFLSCTTSPHKCDILESAALGYKGRCGLKGFSLHTAPLWSVPGIAAHLYSSDCCKTRHRQEWLCVRKTKQIKSSNLGQPLYLRPTAPRSETIQPLAKDLNNLDTDWLLGTCCLTTLLTGC